MNQRERHMPLQTMACFMFNAFEGVKGGGAIRFKLKFLGEVGVEFITL